MRGRLRLPSRDTLSYLGLVAAALGIGTIVNSSVIYQVLPIEVMFVLGRITFIEFACIGLGFSAGSLVSAFRDLSALRTANYNGPSHSMAVGRRNAETFRLIGMLYLYDLALRTGSTVLVPTVAVTQILWFHVAVAVLLAASSIGGLITSVAVQRAVTRELARQTTEGGHQ